MRQRLGIADVLIKQPKVVFLDEPTQGIDPVGVEQLLKIIKEMPQQGITVMIASHMLHQMQRVCDRVGIMSGGRLVAEGTIESLSEELGRGSGVTVELEVDVPDEELQKALLAAPGVLSVAVTGNTYRIRCSREARPQLSQRVMQGGKALISMHTTDDALQEIYLRYFQGGG
jgi:ABC-2 type transport system ATP-binding protein